MRTRLPLSALVCSLLIAAPVTAEEIRAAPTAVETETVGTVAVECSPPTAAAPAGVEGPVAESAAISAPTSGGADGADGDSATFATELERRLYRDRLIAEREQRAFEAAVARYERFAPLTRDLTAAQAAALERGFAAELDLYLRKRAFTRSLQRQRSASPDDGATSRTVPASRLPSSMPDR